MNLFQFFWAPGIIRFRLLFLPALIVWVFVLWGGLPAIFQKRSKIIVAFSLCTMLGIGISNGLGKIWPATQIQNNQDIARTLWAQKTIRPNDFFLFSGRGDSITNVVPPYFAPRVRSRSLYGYFFSNPSGDFSEIGKTIEQTIRNGGTIYIEEQLLGKEGWIGFAPDETKTMQILKKWFSRYHILALMNGPFHYRVAQMGQKDLDSTGSSNFSKTSVQE